MTEHANERTLREKFEEWLHTPPLNVYETTDDLAWAAYQAGAAQQQDAQALVAAAYMLVADKHQPNFDNISCTCGVKFYPEFSFQRREAWRNHVRALTPADAIAAFNKAVADAKQAGYDECNAQHAATHEQVEQSFAQEKADAVHAAELPLADEITRLRQEGSTLQRAQQGLVEALRKYGEHRSNCTAFEEAGCDCGLTAALAALTAGEAAAQAKPEGGDVK